MLESSLSLFVFFYLNTFVLLMVARTPQLPWFSFYTIISHLFFLLTSLQCSLFCCIVISPLLPKVLELLDFIALGQAEKVKKWHCFGCVCFRATTNTKCIAITWSLTIAGKAWALLAPLSFPLLVCFYFCLSIHLSCHCHHARVDVRTKEKYEGW